MKLGAVGFLKKPFDATSLADAIESALSPGDNWRPSISAALACVTRKPDPGAIEKFQLLSLPLSRILTMARF
jgi:DNA-binding NarL/FixJ family response regulator